MTSRLSGGEAIFCALKTTRVELVQTPMAYLPWPNNHDSRRWRSGAERTLAVLRSADRFELTSSIRLIGFSSLALSSVFGGTFFPFGLGGGHFGNFFETPKFVYFLAGVARFYLKSSVFCGDRVMHI